MAKGYLKAFDYSNCNNVNLLQIQKHLINELADSVNDGSQSANAIMKLSEIKTLNDTVQNAIDRQETIVNHQMQSENIKQY